jgi:hypothetical protein
MMILVGVVAFFTVGLHGFSSSMYRTTVVNLALSSSHLSPETQRQ